MGEKESTAEHVQRLILEFIGVAVVMAAFMHFFGHRPWWRVLIYALIAGGSIDWMAKPKKAEK